MEALADEISDPISHGAIRNHWKYSDLCQQPRRVNQRTFGSFGSKGDVIGCDPVCWQLKGCLTFSAPAGFSSVLGPEGDVTGDLPGNPLLAKLGHPYGSLFTIAVIGPRGELSRPQWALKAFVDQAGAGFYVVRGVDDLAAVMGRECTTAMSISVRSHAIKQ